MERGWNADGTRMERDLTFEGPISYSLRIDVSALVWPMQLLKDFLDGFFLKHLTMQTSTQGGCFPNIFYFFLTKVRKFIWCLTDFIEI